METIDKIKRYISLTPGMPGGEYDLKLEELLTLQHNRADGVFLAFRFGVAKGVRYSRKRGRKNKVQFDPYKYGLTAGEIDAFHEQYSHDAFNTIMAIFEYGRDMGYQAAKEEGKPAVLKGIKTK